MQQIKPVVYIDHSHFDKSNKDYVFEILKANFFNDLTPEEKLIKFGAYINLYTFTTNIDEAHFAMLPMAWNYYIENGKIKLAEDFINFCKSKNKKVASYIAYDYGVTPTVKDIYIFRQSGYESRRLPHQFACPYFLSDQLQKRYHTEAITVREKSIKPLVGFCGQAKVSTVTNARHLAAIALNNFQYYTHIQRREPQVLYPPVLRREKALAFLEDSPLIQTNFIKRTSYRAGANTAEEREKTTLEYYENLQHSDYILCIRGGGNFSNRFFETMLMGRIPLFINTDSILPFDNYIHWKKHTVWIEENEMQYMPQVLSDFHHSIHADDFKQMQLDNRQIWIEYLSVYGIFYHMARIMMEK